MRLTASFFHESYEGRLTAELHNLGLTRTNARVMGGRLVQELCTCSRSSLFLSLFFVLLFVPVFHDISAQRSRTLKRCMTSLSLRIPIIHTLSARNQTRKYARFSSSYCPLCCPLSVQKLLIRRTLARSERKICRRLWRIASSTRFRSRPLVRVMRHMTNSRIS